MCVEGDMHTNPSSLASVKHLQEVKMGQLQALKSSRRLAVTTVVGMKLCSNVSGHVSAGTTEWNKVKEEELRCIK